MARHNEDDNNWREELKATRFALAFMCLMWAATVTCLIIWTK